MLWVANKFAQLPSLLVQLIDDSILPFFLCKKGFGVYLLVFVPRASYCMVASVERLCMFEGRSEKWLMGSPEDASHR